MVQYGKVLPFFSALNSYAIAAKRGELVRISMRASIGNVFTSSTKKILFLIVKP